MVARRPQHSNLIRNFDCYCHCAPTAKFWNRWLNSGGRKRCRLRRTSQRQASKQFGSKSHNSNEWESRRPTSQRQASKNYWNGSLDTSSEWESCRRHTSQRQAATSLGYRSQRRPCQSFFECYLQRQKRHLLWCLQKQFTPTDCEPGGGTCPLQSSNENGPKLFWIALVRAIISRSSPSNSYWL